MASQRFEIIGLVVILRSTWVSWLLLGVACDCATDVDCDVNPQSTEPQGVHLAYAGDASKHIAVSFFTCSVGGTPQVTLLDSRGKLVRIVSGTTATYYSRQHHDIILSDLDPATTYWYTAGLIGQSTSPRFTFRTAAMDPPSMMDGGIETFTAAVIGDMGVNNSDGTIARLTERAPSLNFTIQLGDMSYADDYDLPLHIEPSSGRSFEAVYDLFQRMVQPIASAMPFMVLPGNHEVSCSTISDWGCPEQQKNFSAFRYRFRMPCEESGVQPAAHHNMWYSFRVGSVHFVSLSSETDFPGAPVTPHRLVGGGAGGGFGDQLGWLRRDLAAARDNPHVKWIVAMAHRPWYSSVALDWPVLATRHVQKAFEPLLYEFGVDVFLCGHKHFYERTRAAHAGKPDDMRGTMHIINGAAGNNEGLQKGGGVGSGLVVAASYNTTGYGELSVVNATALRWRYLSSSDGLVLDEVVLPKRSPQQWRVYKPQTSTKEKRFQTYV